jgi:hypothetical protein
MSPSQDSVTSSSNQGNNALKQIRAQGLSVLSTIIPGRAGARLGKSFDIASAQGSSGNHPAETYEDFVQDQDAALGTLGSGQATDWESMAAAAAIVSGGTATDSRNQRRYNVGDRVLVVGNVNKSSENPNAAADLNMSSGDLEGGIDGEDQDPYGGADGGGAYDYGGGGDDIVAPVNKLGFPVGKGDTDEERKGPYVYVLSTVRKVHFEEDARYYTVTREDNGRDQRADTGEYMIGVPYCIYYGRGLLESK